MVKSSATPAERRHTRLKIAVVSGDARVRNYAMVGGRAAVRDRARIGDLAELGEGQELSGDAWCRGVAAPIGDANLFKFGRWNASAVLLVKNFAFAPDLQF